MALTLLKPFNLDTAQAYTFTGNFTSTSNLVASGNLTVTGLTNLGPVGNVTVTGGSNGQFLKTDGTGNLSWQTISLSSVSNGNSNVSISSANGNITLSAAGTANIITITGTGSNFSGVTNLGDPANIKISGGAANFVLKTDGAGNLSWVAQSGGGGGGGGSLTLANTSLDATFYPVFADATSGDMTVAYLNNSLLTFNPNSGTLTAQDFNTLSDVTLKDNVEPIADPFEILNKLLGVGFTWKNSGKKSYGLIAQMIEKILPELVTNTPDGKKSVNYIPIIAFLLEAVKRQQEDIDLLKKR